MNKALKIKAVSPLEKILPGEAPEGEFRGFSMLKNERKAFQIYIEAPGEEKVNVKIQAPLGCIKIYTVEYIKAGFAINQKTADDFVIKSESGMYPDLLLPTDGDIELKDGRCVLWAEIAPTEPLSPGVYTIKATVTAGEKWCECSLQAEVIDALLPKQSLIYTNWFHTDCLMTHYGFSAFSDEYWRVVKNYLKVAAEHGMNCVLTPLFTPPLDTAVGGERPTVQLIGVKVTGKDTYSFDFSRLLKWIETARECGIEYFELSHFFTQWGAKAAPKVMADVNGEEKQIFGWETHAIGQPYKKFLTALAGELKPFLEGLGLKDKVIIHVSDEPQLVHYFVYRSASRLIHSLFSGWKIADALSEYKYYSHGIVTTPIAATNHIEPFIGKVSELWAYYCCGQDNKYVSNRFFSIPSMRNRVLGFQLYKYKARGFLHWGYNFWYTRYSKAQINPFEVADAGGAFQAGDSFVVYPNEDGTPYVSLRLKVFYDALQDMMALQELERLTSREHALEVLEEGLEKELTFSDYPHDDKWLLATRERINKEIQASIEKSPGGLS